MKTISSSFIILCLLLAGCSVQKRHYLKGFHVEWRSGKHNRALADHQRIQKPSAPETTTSTKVTTETSALLADAGPAIPQQLNVPVNFQSEHGKFFADECDLIVMRNGDEIKVKVTEIGYDFIKYKRCDNPDGPLYTVKKSEVFMIKYPNGTKDIIEAPATSSQQQFSASNLAPPQILHPGALVSFLLAMITLIIFIVALIPAIIFFMLTLTSIGLAIRSINKITNSGTRYKGKGFAIAAIIISVLLLATGLILISLM